VSRGETTELGEPRELWQLAKTLDVTAGEHFRAARMMAPINEVIADGLRALGEQMQETSRQIMAGRYGHPGRPT
jgi:hypothetical protein